MFCGILRTCFHFYPLNSYINFVLGKPLAPTDLMFATSDGYNSVKPLYKIDYEHILNGAAGHSKIYFTKLIRTLKYLY